jgi:hypothetical protein
MIDRRNLLTAGVATFLGSVALSAQTIEPDEPIRVLDKHALTTHPIFATHRGGAEWADCTCQYEINVESVSTQRHLASYKDFRYERDVEGR